MPHLTSRQFNHDVSAAKRAAKDGPVVITDRGQPSHVLLTYADFQRMTRRAARPPLSETLRMEEDLDFEPGRVSFDVRPVDL
ncbi:MULTISPECIES: type II toxin-antitoxin system prevent-host-death family antitoxin [Cellulomonas]|uniref:type II toxin-antitoxin system prevent-host-death family antitoxin n=1 Tax=Cellulomonas TaxID=1707 RepID=UPI0010A802D9|nr:MULTISPECIES: type II toxin-antitoxin system prevent-host-death family antitoxin [Cellulomonas]